MVGGTVSVGAVLCVATILLCSLDSSAGADEVTAVTVATGEDIDAKGEAGVNGTADDAQKFVVVRLQDTPPVTSNSFIDVGYGTLPNMDQMTVCLRLRLRQYSINSTIVSYYANQIDNNIYIGIGDLGRFLKFMCCYPRLTFSMVLPQVRLFTWHHMCVAVNLDSGQARVVLNGQVFSQNMSAGLEARSKQGGVEQMLIREGGHLVLGQDLDTLDGGFNNIQALIGDLADWRLYNTSLNLDVMNNFVTCRDLPKLPQPILQFEETMTGFEMKGNSRIYTLRKDDVCGTTIADSLVMFPIKMEFKEAAAWCKIYGGGLVMPTNGEENAIVFKMGLTFEDQCKGTWSTNLWLGMEENSITGGWKKLSDASPITWSNFALAFSTPGQDCLCASVASAAFPYIWYCGPCRYATCAVCHYLKQPIFQLRGQCTSDFDHHFTIKSEVGERPKFIGYLKSQIVWNGDGWRLEMTRNVSWSWAVMVGFLMQYPVGRRTWRFESQHCGQLETQLVITSCSGDEYTCDDGHCVPRALRCDHRPDCDDSSDEHNCHVITLPEGYSRQLPPPPTSGRPFHIQLSQEITSVRQFDLVGSRVSLDIIQQTKWRDARVIFHNLKRGNFSNKAEVPDALWLPDFSVESGSRSPAEVAVRSSSLLVQRETEPLPDDRTRLSEDEVYDGASNTLLLVQQNTITFSCHFHLSKYPFDTQRCALVYRLLDTGQRFLYSAGKVKFEGNPVLLEYEVVEVEATTKATNGDSFFSVEIEFRNQFGYYIGNAFLPSVLLVTICYLTFWFSLHDFQDRIMVSLTSLLVLTGLLTQTSQSIPKTAYLKLIDVWYVVLICVDFFIIVVQVVIEGLRRQVRSPPQFKKVKRFGLRAIVKKKHRIMALSGLPGGRTGQAWTGESEGRAARLNKLCIKVFPVICAFFLISFFIAASS